VVRGAWLAVAGAAAVGLAACPAHAAFPGRNGRLAVVVSAGEPASLRVLAVFPDGSRRRQLAAGAESVHWSADGDSLVLGLPCVKSGCNDNAGGPSGPGVLRILNVRTGRSRRVVTSSAAEFQGPQAPSWTRGGRLVWSQHVPVEGGSADVVLADSRGRRQRILTHPGAAFLLDARAAPTGGVVAVAVSSPILRLSLLSLSGAPERILIDCDRITIADPSCPLGEGPPDWSPDGSQIAFAGLSNLQGARMVRVLHLASGVIRDVRPGTAPFWSPDGLLLGSVSPGRRAEIGPPIPGPVTTLPLHGVIAADWQAR
jgi:hypothetical protein